MTLFAGFLIGLGLGFLFIMAVWAASDCREDDGESRYYASLPPDVAGREYERGDW